MPPSLFAQFFVLWCNFLFVFNAKGVLRLQWWRIRACCNFFRGRWIFSKKLVGSCLATARCLFSFFFLTVRRNCSCTKNMAIFDVVLFFFNWRKSIWECYANFNNKYLQSIVSNVRQCEVTYRKYALKQGNRIGVRFIEYDIQGVFLKCAEILPTRLFDNVED
jgi:hypothetical protein